MTSRTDGSPGHEDLRCVRGARPTSGVFASGVRRGPIAGVFLAASLAACSTRSGSTTAGIEGSNDLALVGDLLFVTSSDDNELHVIDVALPTPDFVRAPNPLHPLSIPVVDRPIALAKDVIWANGIETSGSYVYALSANSREVSIVGAARESLVQKAKATLSAGGTITALAAQGSGDGSSTLFLATYDGSTGHGRIDQFNVEKPDELPPDKVLTPGAPLVDVCGAVTSVLVLPDGQLAWSSRPRTESANCAASDKLAGIRGAGGSTKELRFPFPVRRLFTHAKFAGHSEAELIFGVLDEGSCAGAPECRGILAVVGPKGPLNTGGTCGTDVGDVACDFTNRPMLPIFTRGELIMGAAALPDVAPILPASALGALTTQLTGVYSTSDGRIVFFDAQNLRHFDIDSALPTASAPRLRAPDGSLLVTDGGPVPETIALADGAARDESIHFTFLGDLPGFSKIASPSNPSTSLDVAVDPRGIVQQDDLAYFVDGGCPSSMVAGPPAVGTDGGFTITFQSQIGGPGCGALSIRPPITDPKPWVVAGTSSGFLGRIAPSANSADVQELPAEQVRRNALFFNRPPGFDPDNPPPLLKLAFLDPPSLPAPATRQPGYSFEMTTDDGFRMAEVTPQTVPGVRTNVGGSMLLQPPDLLWVTYPSANTVFRLELHSVIAGTEARTIRLR